jgi:hypothetical protein
VSLTNTWLQMLDGSLVRADRIIEIELHPTPEIAGKPSRWLLDVVLAVPVGSGGPATEGWQTWPLHRTLAQTSEPPTGADRNRVGPAWLDRGRVRSSGWTAVASV